MTSNGLIKNSLDILRLSNRRGKAPAPQRGSIWAKKRIRKTEGRQVYLERREELIEASIRKTGYRWGAHFPEEAQKHEVEFLYSKPVLINLSCIIL